MGQPGLRGGDSVISVTKPFRPVTRPEWVAFESDAANDKLRAGFEIRHESSIGGRRETILYMLTAHIAQVLQGSATQAASSLVGQVTGATEGSVTVALAEMQNPGAAWFTQTKYGMMAWQALAPYRTALYSAAPQIPLASQSLAGRLGYLGGFPFAS